MAGSSPAMTIRMVACESFLAKTHRNEAPAGWRDVNYPSENNTKSQSLFRASPF